MPLDSEQIHAVHDDVRAFFKGNPKSTNKVYLDLDDPDVKGRAHAAMISRLRREQRDHGHGDAMQRRPVLLGTRAFKSGNFTAFGREVLMQEAGKRAGNCMEMTAAAAFLVLQRGLGTPWFGAITLPGDHAFCLISALSAPPRANNVLQLMNDASVSWVIDPWANICCRAVDYPKRLTLKLAQWGQQGKAIIRAKEDSDDGDIEYAIADAPRVRIAYMTSGLRFLPFPALAFRDSDFKFSRR